MKAEVIIVAGGIGKRFKSSLPKQFINLNGKPVFLWSVKTFLRIPCVKKIIMVVPANMLEDLEKKYKRLKKTVWTSGGKERFDSVREGLKLIDKTSDLTAIHDAARPLTNIKDIKAVFETALKTKAAIAAQKTQDTIKTAANGKIIKTLDRKVLWNAQTPQIFDTKLLIKAYSKKIGANTTDDSQLIENLGEKVSIVEVKFPNFKITSKQDFKAAQTILKR
ncbi:MAG: 2-C-methyl-D-erythritol 4-phosphate cytidylyltransferase [Elusimicrobiota bacterium]|jgi:2-C-methyl-D-erythritol 4-phosphate cytidylyltransferase|nr:2-C-methyl-D-erythritol 4-phosphate cytidylyltransferase [Elusimicrobiota bacterium]